MLESMHFRLNSLKGKVLRPEFSSGRGTHFSSMGKALGAVQLHSCVDPVFAPSVSIFSVSVSVVINQLGI